MAPVYQCVARKISLNAEYVLLLCPKAHQRNRPYNRDNSVVCRSISAEELRACAHDPRFTVSNRTVDNMLSQSLVAIGAFVGAELAGISFYATDFVDPEHNSAGARFHGIGLRLPSNTCYQFKVFVLPEFRGKRINSSMIEVALNHFAGLKIDHIVTTTEITNAAFYSSATRLGFEVVGHTFEWVFCGKSFFKYPKSIMVSIPEEANQKSRVQLFSKMSEC